MAQTWMDGDGLYHKYGVTKATPNKGGEFRETNDQMHKVQFKLDLTALTQSETPVSDQVFIPSGARIVKVDVLTHTAAATGTAIDLGLIRTDRSTEIDYNGLLAAFPLAHMDAAGEHFVIQQSVTIPTGATGTGALIGTTTSNVGYVTCSQTDATSFTAGLLYVTIYYMMP